MSKFRKLSSSDQRTYLVVAMAFILLCGIIGVLCSQYYKKLQETVKTESSGYIQEISKQMGVNVSKTIEDNFSVLGTIETVLINSEVNSFAEFEPIARNQQNYWNYESLLLVDADGTAYDLNGKAVIMSDGEYLRDVIKNKKVALSATQLLDGMQCVVFAVPIDEMQIDGIGMCAIATSYNLKTFDRILAMTAFDGKGYAHIVRSDGSMLLRSSSENAIQTGYNVISSLASANGVDRDSFEQVKTDIAAGVGGQIEFKINSTHEYMAYNPVSNRNWTLLTFVPVSVVNKKSDFLLKLTIMLCSFITLTFAGLTAFLMITTYRHKRNIERFAYVDSVTNGNTIQKFYDLAKIKVHSSNHSYALVYTNIEKFKILNEQFGRDSCDCILCGMQNGISSLLTDNECMGRIFADNFCILIEYDNEEKLALRFSEWYSACKNDIEQKKLIWLPLIVEFGVYVIEDISIPFPLMIDRAKLALRETARELRGKLRYAIYDEQVRKQLYREKQLEDMMEKALKEREFQVYLQPKYHTSGEKIGGAEALVRWICPTEGMIYPDEFISLFEKNGFIVQLDQWVFEEVCKTIRSWLDKGNEPIKVSINCSRVNLKISGFLQQYKAILGKYSVSPSLIEIELTENVVFEDVEFLTDMITEIHSAGFSCSMDDFGSGYSSLNLIRDIPVDVLKLDKIFFRSSSAELSRTESVVGSIITMARALNMQTVAEGVEERFQVDMLKRLGCDYIQGYYFAKPMPIKQFEVLAFDNKEAD